MNRVALLAGVGDNRHLPSNPNHGKPYPTITYADITSRAAHPPHAPLDKTSTDGIICADYTGWDLRKSNVGRDFSMQMLTVDFDSGNFTKQQVVDALNRALGGQHAFTVYSTFSAWTDVVDADTGEITGNKGARWAAIIPLATGWKARTFEAASHGFLDLLEAQGVKVEDRTSAEIKRIRFLPVRGAGGYDYHVQEGDRFSPGANHPFAQYAANRLAIADKEDLERANRHAKYAAKGKQEGERSILAAYRRKHPTTPELLEWLGFSSIDGGRNWHHSSQSSNSYATELFDDGALYTLSGTVAAMGGMKAGQGKYFHDTYDIMCAVHYHGNRTAMEAYARQCLREEDAKPFGWDHMVALGAELWNNQWQHDNAEMVEMLSCGIMEDTIVPDAPTFEQGDGMLPLDMVFTKGEDGELDIFGQTVAALYHSQRKPNAMSAMIATIMGGTACIGGNYCGLDKDDRARGYIIATGESGCGKESAEKDGEKLIERAMELSMVSKVPSEHVPVFMRTRCAALPGSAEGLQDRLAATPDLVITVGEIAEHLRAINSGRAMHKAGTLNELVNIYSKANAYFQTRPLASKEGATVAAPTVSLVATSTEEKLATVLSEDFLKDGTGARFLMFSVERFAEPLRRRQNELNLPAQLIRNIARLANNGTNVSPDRRVLAPMQIKWDDQVADLFHTVALSGDQHPTGSLSRALLNRTPVHAKWLAMVRAALNGTDVTMRIAQWAIDVVMFSNDYKLYLTGNKISYGEGDMAAQKILEKLKSAVDRATGLPRWVSRRELSQLAQVRKVTDGGDRRLDDILSAMVKTLVIEEILQTPTQGKGWPKRLYRINHQTDAFG